MVRTILLFCFVLHAIHTNAQQQDVDKDSTQTAKPKLTISDFAQARAPWSFEQHSNFTFKYGINSRFSLELQGHYDTQILADIFRVPIIAQGYVTKRLYLFTGVEMEMERDKFNLNLPVPQLKLINGMGYDVNSNFQLEFKHDLHFNKSNVGIYGNPELFLLKGKMRF